MRDAMQLRAELVPYIYTAARITHDTGVAFLRPLYYDYPTQNEAYNYPGEYVYGDDIIVYPITVPLNANGLVMWNVWIPPGDWVEWFSGLTLSGPSVVTRAYALTDIPVFVRAGSVIPMVEFTDRPLTGGAKVIPSTLTFRVFACSGCQGSTSVYEDDGDTEIYLNSTGNANYAWTTASYTTVENKITVTVQAADGSFPGFLTQRNFRVKLQGVYGPSDVTVNGANVPFDSTKTKIPSWSYDGNLLAVEVITAPVSVKANTTVVVTTLGSLGDAGLSNGIPLAVNRLAQVKTLLDNQWAAVFQEDYKSLIYGASAGQRMSNHPATSLVEVANFTSVFTTALQEVEALVGLGQTVKSQAVGLVSTAYADVSRTLKHISIV